MQCWIACKIMMVVKWILILIICVSIHGRTNVLMMYHCEINKVLGTTLVNMGATRNYISARYAKRENLRFSRGDANSLRNIRLPNGQNMKILGQCEFELKMSEWTGTVVATILDLEADFDVILGLSWHCQWKPLADWDTLDMFINTPEGAQRIVHKYGDVKRLLNALILTSLEDWPADLSANAISLQDAEREIKGGAKAYLYFIREHGGDSDKDDSGKLNSMEIRRDPRDDSRCTDLDLATGDICQDLSPNSNNSSRSREIDHSQEL